MIVDFERAMITSAFLIMFIMLFRKIVFYKVFKKNIKWLWIIVLVRLLIPLYVNVPHITNPFSSDHLLNEITDTLSLLGENEDSRQNGYINITKSSYFDRSHGKMTEFGDVLSSTKDQSKKKYNYANIKESKSKKDSTEIPSDTNKQNRIFVVWLVGFCILSIYIWGTHIVFMIKCKCAIPINDEFINEFKKEHRVKRKIKLKQFDETCTPLTYGVLRPVVLLPKSMCQLEKTTRNMVLMHELMHIKHFDILLKIFINFALCIYWFNPFVWVMYIFINRDIEMSCDESVLLSLGKENRKTYAMLLADIASISNKGSLICNGFGKSRIKERCVNIMKIQKKSLSCTIFAVVLCITIPVFAFAKCQSTVKSKAPQLHEEEKKESVHREIQSNDKNSENYDHEEMKEDTYSLDQGKTWISEVEYEETKEDIYSLDQGKTWISEVEYEETKEDIYSLDQGKTWISKAEYEARKLNAELDKELDKQDDEIIVKCYDEKTGDKTYSDGDSAEYWTEKEFKKWFKETKKGWQELYESGEVTEIEKNKNIAIYTEMYHEIRSGKKYWRPAGEYWTAAEYEKWLKKYKKSLKEKVRSGEIPRYEYDTNIAVYTEQLVKIKKGKMIYETADTSMEFDPKDVRIGTGRYDG